MTDRPALVRQSDWRQRLAVWLAEVRHTPFGYAEGQLDCMCFAAGAVEAMTGVDLAADWRGYGSAEEGRARLHAAGFATQRGLLASILKGVPPRQARPGDLVVLAGEAVGVCQGRFAYAMSRDGVALVDMADARRAYLVPLPEDVTHG